MSFQFPDHQIRRFVAATIIATATGAALAADHREAPLIREDASADIADVYVFQSPTNPANLVFAMTVNPFSAPSENVTYAFSPNVRYSFHVDTNGDAESESDIDVSFTTLADGSQVFGLTVGSVKISNAPVTPPSEEPEPNAPIITTHASGVLAFAGQRDDPFFFDVVGFNRFLAGTGGFEGNDGFAGYNVSAIVLEVPKALIDDGSSALQVWASTARRRVSLRRSSAGQLEMNIGPFEQIERMGNPAISTALVPLAKKDLYNIGVPADDAADFAGDLVASLMALGTNSENIGILASVAVPDTIKLDTSAPSGYPNGRRPHDDVIDTLLFFIFNQTDVPDGVDANDRPFLASFPYL
ncbi:MAG: DUF4331 family protein, partial [Phycisphaerales bacterium]|nr:DUF4331 family protein [Phycisphaerales bacterium]